MLFLSANKELVTDLGQYELTSSSEAVDCKSLRLNRDLVKGRPLWGKPSKALKKASLQLLQQDPAINLSKQTGAMCLAV